MCGYLPHCPIPGFAGWHDQPAQGCRVAAQLRLEGVDPATPRLEVIPYPGSILTVSCTLLDSTRFGIELCDESMVSKPDTVHRVQVGIRIKIVCHIVA